MSNDLYWDDTRNIVIPKYLWPLFRQEAYRRKQMGIKYAFTKEGVQILTNYDEAQDIYGVVKKEYDDVMGIEPCKVIKEVIE